MEVRVQVAHSRSGSRSRRSHRQTPKALRRLEAHSQSASRTPSTGGARKFEKWARPTMAVSGVTSCLETPRTLFPRRSQIPR